MKINKKHTLIAGTLLAIFSVVNIANASIINTANDSFIDTTTGIEWMDFGINNNQSYNYVASQLGVGGDYEGWNLATSDEVYAMWAVAFDGVGANYYDIDNYGPGQLYGQDGANEVGSIWTDVFASMSYNSAHASNTVPPHYKSTGWFMGADGLSYVVFHQFTDERGPSSYHDGVSLNDSSNWNHLESTFAVNRSTLLVRPNNLEVPEPSSVLLFSLGLMGLALRRMKRPT